MANHGNDCIQHAISNGLDSRSANIKKPVDMKAPNVDADNKKGDNYNFEYLTKNKPEELQMIYKNDQPEYERLFHESKNK